MSRTVTAVSDAIRAGRIPPDTTALTPDALITSHLPLVGYIVSEIRPMLPAHIPVDDLQSAGLVGLVSAASAFDPARGVPFRKYAQLRIRGSILDELRKPDLVSRTTRHRIRQRNQAEEQLTVTLGRAPTVDEIAEYLGCTTTDVHGIDADQDHSVTLSLDAALDPDAYSDAWLDPEPQPETVLLTGEENGYLRAAVDALPPKMRTVITGYFLEGRPMAEIADVLAVSESRVSQIRAEAMVLLRDAIAVYRDTPRDELPGRPGGCVQRRRAAYLADVARRADLTSPVAPRSPTARMNDTAAAPLDRAG